MASTAIDATISARCELLIGLLPDRACVVAGDWSQVRVGGFGHGTRRGEHTGGLFSYRVRGGNSLRTSLDKSPCGGPG
jgi:hypothetical protein